VTKDECQQWRARVCEYRALIRWAEKAGCLDVLASAHQTPITRDDAYALIDQLRYVGDDRVAVDIHFRGRRGRATAPRVSSCDPYRLTLPAGEPGVGFARLRVGIVLHELAHVLDHYARTTSAPPGHRLLSLHRMNHQAGFRARFRELLMAWESRADAVAA
jgi:hypothetical protein